MNFMTPKEAAEKWKICLRQVQYLCADNRIPGAITVNRRWLIPVNATPPEDGRLHHGVTVKADKTPYHFPLYFLTNAWASPRDLDEEEKDLYRAQTLTLQCEYQKSVEICLRLLRESENPTVKIGACFMNADNFTMLGLAEELKTAIDGIKSLAQTEKEHGADFRFLASAAFFESTAIPTELDKIDVEALSPDALTAYEYFMTESLVFRSLPETESAVKIYSSVCRRLEEAGILPSAVMCHAILALLCSRVGDLSGKDYHLKESCRLGQKAGYFKLLSKSYGLMPDEYYRELSAFGEDFADKIKARQHQNIKGWNLIASASAGKTVLENNTDRESELLILLAYGFDDATIAKLKNINEDDVTAMITALCEKHSQPSRPALIQYAQKMVY